MAKLELPAGTTSKLLRVFIQDSTSTSGAGLTGLVFNSAGLTAYYIREGDSATTQIVLVTAVLGTFTSSGFIVVDGTNMPGVYEIGIPNAAIATGKNSVLIFLKGATNMVPVPLEIELTATSNQDAVRGGMTALPNANAGASGGLGTVDSTNSIKIQTPVKRNTALNNFEFVMLNTSGNPQTGLTVTGQVSIDGAAFVNLTNTPATEVAQGWYKINLAAADVNGTNIALRFSAASARDTDILLLTLP